jgi:hypothetical protein
MENNTILEFHIVTPYKGPLDWLDECKKSVQDQNIDRPFHVHHHVVIDNDKKGACRNHFETLRKILPLKVSLKNCIIVHLDGDDKLIDSNTFNHLFDIYQNDDVWATYGNYVSRQGSVCRELNGLPFRESFKRFGWHWSHLRTFRHHLSQYLNEDDMKDFSGNWFSSAPDVAIFLPVLEMCGVDRVKFVDKDFVYYRIHNNNEHSSRERLNDQIRCAVEIAQKRPYFKLSK